MTCDTSARLGGSKVDLMSARFKSCFGHAKLEITQRYLNITDVGVVRSMREYWGRQRATGRAHA